MINFLLFLVFVGVVGLLAAMVAENPGEVTMFWFDYRIDTSVAFIIFSTVLTVILFIALALLIRRIISAPTNFWKYRSFKQLRAGITELTYSVAALAANDIKAAQLHTHKVEKLLGRIPLTLLLSAQIAKTRGDDVATQGLLEQLLEYKETKFLAARSLSDSANKQNSLPKALALAKQARELNPKDPASILAIIGLHVRLHQWSDALLLARKANIARSERQRIYALVQISWAKLLLENAEDNKALKLVAGAIKTLPYFAPAVVIAASVYYENNQKEKAFKILLRAWRYAPSQLLLDSLHEIIKHEPDAKKAKLLAKFSGQPESEVWICKNCGHSQQQWEIHCNNCNSFDSLTALS